MARTKVTWAQYAANAWRGCAEVHIGCRSCYAKAQARRFPGAFGTWGPDGARIIADFDRLFRQVAGWNRRARCRCGEAKFDGGTCESCLSGAPIVFWNDVSDTFEARSDLAVPRQRMFAEGIDPNQNLTHVLLTKRPENVRRMWPIRNNPFMRLAQQVTGHTSQTALADIGNFVRSNVWLLLSASDQQTLEAGLPHICGCHDLVPVWGLSLEPLLASIDLRLAELGPWRPRWIITGGESGPHFRPMEISWVQSIADQCREAGVPLFVKQDCGRQPGQQGRIPDQLWARKEFPR